MVPRGSITKRWVPEGWASGARSKRAWPAARAVFVPVVAVSIAYVVRHLVDPLIVDDNAPFMLLLAAVMASAYLAGVAGGVLATVLALAASLKFMWLESSATLAQSAWKLELGAFVLEALVITALCRALMAARERAEASALEARALAEEARLLQRQVSDAADREQRRIGQDLHDDLGQFLTGIALSGQNLARRMDREGSPHVDETRNLVHMVNESVNRTRQLARGLSPMALDPDSLPMLLSELQERAAELSGRDVSFDMLGGNLPDLPHEAVLNLYRIAQEAVGNALKHSGGQHIEVELECAPHALRLSVTDDGIGPPSPPTQRSAASTSTFPNGNPPDGADPAAATRRVPEGMGLRVMHFRAKSIGATLDISPAGAGGIPTRGTRVLVELALPLPLTESMETASTRP